jgi:hypothetical protein
MFTGSGLTDTQSGFRAFSRKAFQEINIEEHGMSASLEVLNQAFESDLRVKEVPINVSYVNSEPTVNPVKHGLQLMKFTLSMAESGYRHRNPSGCRLPLACMLLVLLATVSLGGLDGRISVIVGSTGVFGLLFARYGLTFSSGCLSVAERTYDKIFED